jgi:hypothetical protein
MGSICKFSKQSDTVDLLRRAALIILPDLNVAGWDIKEVIPNLIQRDGCVDLYS